MRILSSLLFAGLTGLAVAAAPSADAKPERIDPAEVLGLSAYVEPGFPALARGRGVLEGEAVVVIAWGDDGAPRDVVAVTSTDRLFADSAVEAMRQWRRTERAGNPPMTTCLVTYRTEGVVICGPKAMTGIVTPSAGRGGLGFVTLVQSDLDAPPRALAQPMPEFSRAVVGSLESGQVVVEFFVDEEGCVRAPVVRAASVPALAEPTLAALCHWRFETSRRRGKRVVYSERWAFDFKPRG